MHAAHHMPSRKTTYECFAQFKKSFKSLVYLSQSDRLENLCFGIRLLIVKGCGEQVNLLDLRSLRYFVSKRCCGIISTLRAV